MSVNDSCYVRLFDFFNNKPSHFIIPFSSKNEAINFCEMFKERKRLENPGLHSLCIKEYTLYDNEESCVAQCGQGSAFFQLFFGYGSTYTKMYGCDYKIISQLPEDTNDPKKFPVFETFQEFLNSI